MPIIAFSRVVVKRNVIFFINFIQNGVDWLALNPQKRKLNNYRSFIRRNVIQFACKAKAFLARNMQHGLEKV